MAEEIRFPRLGWSMEEGKFIQWLKRDGELVREGEPLFEMEGEKALQEIEAVGNGILKIADDAPVPDEVVTVGKLLGYLLLPNELLSEAIPKPSLDSGDGASVELKGGSLAEAEICLPIDEDASFETLPIAASPRARRLADSLGIDWRTVHGTGRDGRIREADVREFADRHSSNDTQSSKVKGNLFTPRRKMIAERLRLSRTLTVPVTLTTKVDVSRLVVLRELQKKMQSTRIPAFTDLFAKYVAIVLARHPAMAVRWNEDHSVLSEVPAIAFHIGIAVDTKDGLLVPVLRDVYAKSIDDIVTQSKTLIEKARAGRLNKDEMTDGVISITNLGAYGIDAFTPIINVPEIAILGLGTIRKEPAFDDKNQVISKDWMVLSLTFDHAAVDGAPAAAFLKDLVNEIESA
jgi:pyruvate dehydrogenase E2 component (dihydrolipoamide acetyltransferase)